VEESKWGIVYEMDCLVNSWRVHDFGCAAAGLSGGWDKDPCGKMSDDIHWRNRFDDTIHDINDLGEQIQTEIQFLWSVQAMIVLHNPS